MRTKMRSRVHVVLVRVSEFHLWGKNMELIQLRRTPAFLILVENEISAGAEIFIILTSLWCLVSGWTICVKAAAKGGTTKWLRP